MAVIPKLVLLDAKSEAPEFVEALLGAFEAGTASVGIYDENDYLRFANRSFITMFGLVTGKSVTFADIVLHAAQSGQTVRIEASDPTAFIADAQSRRRAVVSLARQRSFPVDFVDGRCYWCTETLLATGWIVLTGSDITALKHTERLLSSERDHAVRLSGIDELTGLPNRRFVLAQLDAMLNSVGRLGGEEFLVLFPSMTGDGAKTILDQLLLAIPPVSSRLPAHVSISLSFSAGVAQFHPDETRADLLLRADRALYVAKLAGRSRVEIDQSPRLPCKLDQPV